VCITYLQLFTIHEGIPILFSRFVQVAKSTKENAKMRLYDEMKTYD